MLFLKGKTVLFFFKDFFLIRNILTILHFDICEFYTEQKLYEFKNNTTLKSLLNVRNKQ